MLCFTWDRHNQSHSRLPSPYLTWLWEWHKQSVFMEVIHWPRKRKEKLQSLIVVHLGLQYRSLRFQLTPRKTLDTGNRLRTWPSPICLAKRHAESSSRQSKKQAVDKDREACDLRRCPIRPKYEIHWKRVHPTHEGFTSMMVSSTKLRRVLAEVFDTSAGCNSTGVTKVLCLRIDRRFWAIRSEWFAIVTVWHVRACRTHAKRESAGNQFSNASDGSCRLTDSWVTNDDIQENA